MIEFQIAAETLGVGVEVMLTNFASEKNSIKFLILIDDWAQRRWSQNETTER